MALSFVYLHFLYVSWFAWCFYSQVLPSPPLAVFFLLYFFDFSFLEFAFTPSFPVSPVESPSLCSVIFIGYFQFYFGSFGHLCLVLSLSSLVSLSLISSRCISHGLVYILSQSPLTHCSVVSQSCVLPCSIVPVVLVVRFLVCDHLANCFWTHLEQPAKKVPFPFPPCVLQPATQLLFFIN